MIDSEIYSEIKTRVGMIHVPWSWYFCENGKFSATALNIKIKAQHKIYICFNTTADFVLSKTQYGVPFKDAVYTRVSLGDCLKRVLYLKYSSQYSFVTVIS